MKIGTKHCAYFFINIYSTPEGNPVSEETQKKTDSIY